MVFGIILIGIGLGMLMINLDLFDWHFFRFWRWRVIFPVAMIAFGVWLLLRAARLAGRPFERGESR